MLDALFPRSRQRVLSLIFGQPDRSFAMTELIELAQVGSGAVQRELERLTASGLVDVNLVGGQKRYSANRASPIFDELGALVAKTAGVAGALAAALAPLGDSVRFAALYGSVAKETDRASSDIDVLLVGDDLALESVFSALEPAERRLGRRITPTVYTPEEFNRRRREGHPFLTKVLAGEHIVLLGSEDAVTSR
jgi:predicted nucleotidyltransferase